MTPSPSLAYPPSYYAATANPHKPFPALEGSIRADVCVVGGGFTGISTALHLAEKGFSVVLLEAGPIGWGASGRNGGQVGSGQRRETLELERWFGRETARRLWDFAEEAKQILRDRIARHAIRCDYRPGNLMAITRRRFVADAEAEARNLREHYGYDQITLLNQDEVRAHVDSPNYVGGSLDAGGGHLHPLNFALGMAGAARDAGASLFAHSRVDAIEWSTPRARVKTSHGTVEADYVALCTNAYLEGLEPRIRSRLMPIDSYIIATEPLGEERARSLIPCGACVFSTKFVVDYYRLSSDHRLLFGGGETYNVRAKGDVKDFVRPFMLDIFPQLADARIDHGWSGSVGITLSRLPHFGRLGGNGFFAQGFSGHGVALTQVAGKLLAEVISGTAERFDVMASIPHRPFPGGRLLQRPLLVAGMLYYSLKDRL